MDKQMVSAMIDVFRWAEERGIHEFKRKDINHITLRHGSTVNSNWGYVAWLTGIFYHPDGKRGRWGVHRGRMIEFLNGKRKVCIRAEIDPTKPKESRKEMVEYATFKNIPNISEVLDSEGEFIAEYVMPDIIPEDAEVVSQEVPKMPIEGMTVRARHLKRAYTGGGYQQDQVYDLVIERLSVGRPVRILHPVKFEYPDLRQFQKDWKIING